MKFSEVVAELEKNPKRKFTYNGSTQIVYKMSSTGYFCSYEGDTAFGSIVELSDLFIQREFTMIPIERQVAWFEALGEWYNGKVIKCVLDNATFEYDGNTDCIEIIRKDISRETKWYVIE